MDAILDQAVINAIRFNNGDVILLAVVEARKSDMLINTAQELALIVMVQLDPMEVTLLNLFAILIWGVILVVVVIAIHLVAQMIVLQAAIIGHVKV